MNHPFDSNNKDPGPSVGRNGSRTRRSTTMKRKANGLPERRKAGKHCRTVSLSDFDPSAKPFRWATSSGTRQ